MKRLNWILLLMVVGLNACLDVDDLPLSELDPYTDKIVVNGIISSGEQLSVQITNSTSSVSSELPGLLSNADVSISQNNQDLNVNFDLGSQKYVASGTPNAGDIYRLDVRAQGYAGVNAAVQIPKSIQATATLVENGGVDTSGLPSDLLSIDFSDDGQSKNYYKVNFFYYNGNLGLFIPMSFALNDPGFTEFNSQKLNDGSLLFNDELFNGKVKKLSTVAPFGQVTGNPPYKYLIQLESISEDLYRYYTTLQRARDARDANFNNAFNNAVVIHSNINRGLGILGASYSHRDTLK